MNKRKKFVDTMDNAGRLLGQIAHRDEKVLIFIIVCGIYAKSKQLD